MSKNTAKKSTSRVSSETRPAKGRILRDGIVDISSSEIAKTNPFKKMLNS